MKTMLLLMLMMLCLYPAAAEEPEAPLAPVLILEGNRTTGFDWSWEVDQEHIVGIACAYAVNWQPESDGDIMPTGVGGHSRMTLTGIAPGEATITFAYRRPWEEKEPLYTLIYRIRVDVDLNVTILGSSFDW